MRVFPERARGERGRTGAGREAIRPRDASSGRRSQAGHSGKCSTARRVVHPGRLSRPSPPETGVVHGLRPKASGDRDAPLGEVTSGRGPAVPAAARALGRARFEGRGGFRLGAGAPDPSSPGERNGPGSPIPRPGDPRATSYRNSRAHRSRSGPKLTTGRSHSNCSDPFVLLDQCMADTPGWISRCRDEVLPRSRSGSAVKTG